jgi:hypothetical protein
MSGGRLIRWAGLAGAIGGLLLLATDIVTWAAFYNQPASVVGASSAWVITLSLEVLAAYLAFLALVGLYARQATQSGAFGFASFIIASLSTALNIGVVWAGAFLVPELAAVAPNFLDAAERSPSGMLAVGSFSAIVLLALGWGLFGIASLRAKVLPALPSWLLIVGAILSLVLGIVDLPLDSVLFGVALVWLGWWLWSEKGTSSV